MMSMMTERRLLQFCILLGGCVPVVAGLAGLLQGYGFVIEAQWQKYFPLFMGEFAPGLDLDSHFRYLSGLLLAIGLGFWSYVPTIETKTERFRLLTLIVAMGGLSRLISLILVGIPSKPMLFGLCMELVVTPLLCVWQNYYSNRALAETFRADNSR